MRRYLAVVWDPTNKNDADIARSLVDDTSRQPADLHSIVRIDGLSVFSSDRAGGEPAPSPSSPGTTGVVLGTLFKRGLSGSEARVATPVIVTADTKVAVRGGQHLLDHYWGRYIAIVRSRPGGRTWILRDPSGGLPCFFTRKQGVYVFFSHLEDCFGLGFACPSINWNFIAAYLVDPQLQQAQTGLDGIFELPKGDYIEIEGSSYQRKALWNPRNIAVVNPIEHAETAIAAMREVLPTCATTLASGYKRIIHRVSGGLDSSIVLACLSKTSPRAPLTCVTYYDDSIWGDERESARLAAQHARCALIERKHQPARVNFDAVLRAASMPSPTWYLLNYAHRLSYSELAAELDADAIFSGAGGDAVLFRDPGQVLPAADYLYHHPFGSRSARVLFDTALASRRALWNVLPPAFVHGLIRRPVDLLKDIEQGLQFIDASVVTEAKRSGLLQPSWFTPGERCPPGKLHHIYAMSTAEWTPQPYAARSDPDEIGPLLAQPVVELMLRIPTYLLIAGGRDRMLARRAFASDLPPQLIARVSKGGQNDLSLQILKQHEARIRELALEGRLCQEGLLNRRKMESVLSSDYDSNTDGLVEILHTHLSVEIWFQSLPARRVAPCTANGYSSPARTHGAHEQAELTLSSTPRVH